MTLTLLNAISDNSILELFNSIALFMYKLIDFITYQFSWIGTELGVILSIALGIVIVLRIFGR